MLVELHKLGRGEEGLHTLHEISRDLLKSGYDYHRLRETLTGYCGEGTAAQELMETMLKDANQLN